MDSDAGTRRALWALSFVVLVWGVGPPITKLITAPPLVGALVRFGISFPVLFAVVYARGGKITKRLLADTAVPGLAFGINLILVFATLQEATVAVLSTVIAMQPALLLMVAKPLFGERPSMTHVGWSFVGVGGAAIVILGAGSDVRASALGMLFALAAMLTFSVYFVVTRIARSTRNVDPIDWMAGVNFWAFMAAVPPSIFLVRGDEIGQFGGYDWLWIAFIAYITGVGGHVAMSWVHGFVEAARSSLYLLSMHVVAVSLAWPIHDERVTLVQAVGGVVLLGAVMAVIRLPTTSVRRSEARGEPDREARPA